tara:strand:- start:35 stop:1432 length:1398 start_codon:yes stop_codon:yes gene_type:complete
LSFFPGWLLLLKNYDELILQDILITILIVAITFTLWIIVKRIVGNENKSSLIIGMGIGFFFYFGYIQDALKGVMFFGIPFDKTSILITLSAIVFIIFTIYILKTKRNLQPPLKILNVVTITILIVVVIPILIPNSFAEKSNVYHIILDEYTDNEILTKKFGHDNTEFLNFLKTNKFYVPEKIFSMSSSTPHELNSILNMEYPESYGWVSDNYQKMNDNKVMQIFSENDYRIIETNSMMRYKNFSYVDENLCYDKNFINSEFLDQLLNKSIIRYFMEKHQENTRRDTVRCSFDALNQIPIHSEKPTYVFAHLYVPHPPFLFGPNGESITPDHGEISGLQSWENPEGYTNQLIFATTEIKKIVENIILNDSSAIIIIQGDTGTLTGTDQESQKTFDDVYQSHSILYAIRISDDINPEEINSVNTYRIIFNHIFNLNYDYLESYNFQMNDIGELIDITEKLKSYDYAP